MATEELISELWLTREITGVGAVVSRQTSPDAVAVERTCMEDWRARGRLGTNAARLELAMRGEPTDWT